MLDLIISDLHIPFQDDIVVDKVLNLMEEVQPDRVILNGDIIDMWSVSHYSKDPLIGKDLHDELDMGRAFVERIADTFPKAKKIYIFGNHEARFQRFLMANAPGLVGLRGLSVEDQLELKQNGFEIVNSRLKESYYDTGKGLLVGHFDKVNKHSAYTAKNLVEQYGQSVIQAHTHRTGMYFKRVHDTTLIGVESGCLSDLSPKYMLFPNWQHGFVTVKWIDDKYFINLIPIIDGGFYYEGEYIA